MAQDYYKTDTYKSNKEEYQSKDDSVGYSGPQRPCCGRGCYDCVLFSQ